VYVCACCVCLVVFQLFELSCSFFLVVWIVFECCCDVCVCVCVFCVLLFVVCCLLLTLCLCVCVCVCVCVTVCVCVCVRDCVIRAAKAVVPICVNLLDVFVARIYLTRFADELWDSVPPRSCQLHYNSTLHVLFIQMHRSTRVYICMYMYMYMYILYSIEKVGFRHFAHTMHASMRVSMRASMRATLS